MSVYIVQYKNVPNQEFPLKQYNVICLIITPREMTKHHTCFFSALNGYNINKHCVWDKFIFLTPLPWPFSHYWSARTLCRQTGCKKQTMSCALTSVFANTIDPAWPPTSSLLLTMINEAGGMSSIAAHSCNSTSTIQGLSVSWRCFFFPSLSPLLIWSLETVYHQVCNLFHYGCA